MLEKNKSLLIARQILRGIYKKAKLDKQRLEKIARTQEFCNEKSFFSSLNMKRLAEAIQH